MTTEIFIALGGLIVLGWIIHALVVMSARRFIIDERVALEKEKEYQKRQIGLVRDSIKRMKWELKFPGKQFTDDDDT